MPSENSTGALIVRENNGRPFYEGKWRHAGRQVKRRLGPAWLEPDEAGGWRKRRGRCPEDQLDARRAWARLAETMGEVNADLDRADREDAARAARPVTFAEVAADWLRHLRDVEGAKPATLRDYGYLIREDDDERPPGRLAAAFGNRPAVEVTPREVSEFLRGLDADGMKPRNVNKHRAVLHAIYAYGCDETTYALPRNPVAGVKRRREAEPETIDFYEPDEVEALARAARDPQDGGLFRVAAYTGLRMGELLALRWRDVDFAADGLTVRAAISAGQEVAPKSRKARRVALSPQAAQALARVGQRPPLHRPRRLRLCEPGRGPARRVRAATPLRRRPRRCRPAPAAVPQAAPLLRQPARPRRARPRLDPDACAVTARCGPPSGTSTPSPPPTSPRKWVERSSPPRARVAGGSPAPRVAAGKDGGLGRRRCGQPAAPKVGSWPL